MYSIHFQIKLIMFSFLFSIFHSVFSSKMCLFEYGIQMIFVFKTVYPIQRFGSSLVFFIDSDKINLKDH